MTYHRIDAEIIRDLQDRLREAKTLLKVALMKGGPVEFRPSDLEAAALGQLEESFYQGKTRYRWLPPASSDSSSVYFSELED